MGLFDPVIEKLKNTPYARPLICVVDGADMVIAGAMMDGDDDTDDDRLRMANGGWVTPYAPHPYRNDKLGEHQVRHRVVIHARGFYHAEGHDGAWDMATEVVPQLYALVTHQVNGRKFYLRAGCFDESSRFIEGGTFDLTRASEHISGIPQERSAFALILDHTDPTWDRPWHITPKKGVPSNMRQVLHAVDEDLRCLLTENFGRKPGYFTIRRR